MGMMEEHKRKLQETVHYQPLSSMEDVPSLHKRKASPQKAEVNYNTDLIGDTNKTTDMEETKEELTTSTLESPATLCNDEEDEEKKVEAAPKFLSQDKSIKRVISEEKVTLFKEPPQGTFKQSQPPSSFSPPINEGPSRPRTRNMNKFERLNPPDAHIPPEVKCGTPQFRRDDNGVAWQWDGTVKGKRSVYRAVGMFGENGYLLRDCFPRHWSRCNPPLRRMEEKQSVEDDQERELVDQTEETEKQLTDESKTLPDETAEADLRFFPCSGEDETKVAFHEPNSGGNSWK